MCNSTTFALRHTQILISSILRHFRPPSRHLLLNTHDTNMEFLQLNGPLLDIFLFFSKTKIFHSHPCMYTCWCCAALCHKSMLCCSFLFFSKCKLCELHCWLPPHWPSGKASTLRAEDPGFESRLCQDFFGVESYQWLKNWHSSGYPARRYRVSTGTGRPGVSILWLGEVERLIYNFYLSVAARKIVWADPSLRYSPVARMLSNQQTNKQPTNKQTNKPLLAC